MEYTHKEKAINLCHDFANITNDSNITNVAKQSAILAVERNIKNFEELVNYLFEKKHKGFAKGFLVIIENEKKILAELECISV